MVAITFDILKFVERLKASGFSEEQAKGMTEAVRDAQETHLEELATKGDIQSVRAEIQLVRAEMASKEDVNRIDKQLTIIKWMLALVVIVTVIPALKALFA